MRTAEWRVLILLVISIFINYIDRSNLSIAAPLLEQELSLSPSHIGSLLSAFFWTYALFQLFGVAGWLVDRFDVGLVFASGFLLWSASTAATGFLGSFGALFAMRLLLGAGESIAYPCYSKILAGNFPEHHRGLANALIDAGSKLGPGLGTLLGGLLVAAVGWRLFFVILGIGGMLWLLPWWIWKPREVSREERKRVGTPTVKQILSLRSAWGTFFGLFCANYFWYFLVTWLPLYLVKERHYSLERMAVVGSIVYFTIGAVSALCGFISDRWIRGGGSVTRVRKTFTIAGMGLATIIVAVSVIEDEFTAIGVLLLACICYGMYSSNTWAITQTLAGPRAAGRWTSLQNGFANLAGIVAPWLTGVVVEKTGTFYLAFLIAALVALAGSMMYAFVIGRVEPVAFAPVPGGHTMES
jgi:MFS transporter, ACS family, D-galactonate transporter